MTANSVAMGKHICPVCGQLHDSGEVLIHRRLGNIEPSQTITGESLCGEHQRLFDDGFIALVEVSNEPRAGQSRMARGVASRTGRLCHLKRDKWSCIVNAPAPDGPMCFVKVGFIDRLREVAKMSDGD